MRVMLDTNVLITAIIADVDVFITNDKDFSSVDTIRPEILRIMEFESRYMDSA
jgi:predicted nucleic acid-binding protein